MMHIDVEVEKILSHIVKNSDEEIANLTKELEELEEKELEIKQRISNRKSLASKSKEILDEIKKSS